MKLLIKTFILFIIWLFAFGLIGISAYAGLVAKNEELCGGFGVGAGFYVFFVALPFTQDFLNNLDKSG